MTVPQIIVCVFVVAPLAIVAIVILAARAFGPPQDDDAICTMLGIGGSELRNLRNLHSGSDTVS